MGYDWKNQRGRHGSGWGSEQRAIADLMIEWDHSQKTCATYPKSKEEKLKLPFGFYLINIRHIEISFSEVIQDDD